MNPRDTKIVTDLIDPLKRQNAALKRAVLEAAGEIATASEAVAKLTTENERLRAALVAKGVMTDAEMKAEPVEPKP